MAGTSDRLPGLPEARVPVRAGSDQAAGYADERPDPGQRQHVFVARMGLYVSALRATIGTSSFCRATPPGFPTCRPWRPASRPPDLSADPGAPRYHVSHRRRPRRLGGLPQASGVATACCLGGRLAGRVARFGPTCPCMSTSTCRDSTRLKRRPSGASGQPQIVSRRPPGSLRAQSWPPTPRHQGRAQISPASDDPWRSRSGQGSECSPAPAAGACTTIATLPAVPDVGWVPRLLVARTDKR